MGSQTRVGVTAVAAVLAVLVAAGCGQGPDRRSGAVAVSVPEGGYQVGRLTQTFVDSRRPTPANGEAAAQPSRTLQTSLLYPAAPSPADAQPLALAPGGPFPLIVFGHGFTGSPAAYDRLLRAWVAAGYVVAAPAFPLSNGNAPGGPTQNDLPNQPGDVSFLIGEVLKLAAGGDGPLRGAIEPTRIGVAGHSMGASTTLGAVTNTCCHDDRISAAVVLSGNEVPIPNGTFSVRDPTPILFVHGDSDDVVPYAAGRRAFADAAVPKYFVTLIGGDHNSAFSNGSDSPGRSVVDGSTIAFFDRYLKRRADGLGRLRAAANRPGVASFEAVEK